MKKGRYIGSEDIDMTSGKVYNVIEDSSNEYYYFKDDVGYERLKPKFSFEEVKEPKYVMVKDFKSEEWKKRILLHDLGEQFFKRYVVVEFDDETGYLEGRSNIIARGYVQMKPINEVEEKIEQLEQELEELKQQLNK